MSLHLKIWKRLITNQLHRPSISLLHSFPFYANPPIKSTNFFHQMATLSTTQPDRGVVSDFFMSKCGFSEEDITKGFRHYNHLLRVKSTQNLEEVLLNGCGLTTPAQFRKVVLGNPWLLFHRSERNVSINLASLGL